MGIEAFAFYEECHVRKCAAVYILLAKVYLSIIKKQGKGQDFSHTSRASFNQERFQGSA
jgi:hypothetical protein